MAAKSTPPRLRAKAARRPGIPGSFPWGMATPSPIPVEPSFSRSSRVSASLAAESEGYARARPPQSSRSTPSLSDASRSGKTRSSRRNSAIRMGAELTSLRGRVLPEDAFPARRDQPEAAVPAPVDHVHVRALRPGEDEEVVVEQIHLHQCFLDAHRLGEELVAADDLGLDAVELLPGGEDLVADAQRGALVDVRGPVVFQPFLVLLQLAFDLVDGDVDGRVHVLRLVLAPHVEMTGVQVDVCLVQIALQRKRDVG